MTTETIPTDKTSDSDKKSDTDSHSEGLDKKDTDFISKTEYDRLKASFNDLSAKFRQTNDLVGKIKLEKEEIERKKLEETGDLPKIREQYQADKEAMTKETLKWKELYQEDKKEIEFNKIARACNCLDESIPDLFQLLKSNIDVELVGDTYKVIVKGSHKDLKEYIEEVVRSKPYFLKPNGSGGAGASADKDTSMPKAKYTFEELDKMSPAEFERVVSKDKNLAMIYARGKR